PGGPSVRRQLRRPAATLAQGRVPANLLGPAEVGSAAAQGAGSKTGTAALNTFSRVAQRLRASSRIRSGPARDPRGLLRASSRLHRRRAPAVSTWAKGHGSGALVQGRGA